MHEAVADRFVELLLERTRAWTYGDPMDPAIDMGTVIDEAAAKSFEARVNEAVDARRDAAAGNVRRGALYSPTLVDHVAPDMPLVKYETFGPVSPVIRFKTIDERSGSRTDRLRTVVVGVHQPPRLHHEARLRARTSDR